MIVNCRIEVTDEQANALAVLLKGKPTKARATRKDFNEFVAGCVAAIPEMGRITPKKGMSAREKDDRRDDALVDMILKSPPPRGPSIGSRLQAFVDQELRENGNHVCEDGRKLSSKSDGFLMGWCKVKYGSQLSAPRGYTEGGR